MNQRQIYSLGRITIAFTFIGSGLIPLCLSDPVTRLALLNFLPFPQNWHEPLFYLLVTLDIVCGLLVLFIAHRFIWLFLLVVTIGYTVIITIFAPVLWQDPFGSLLKNGVIISWLYLLYQLEKNHR